MKVLVTYGGMIERIDGVRSIVNTSSGRTGVHIIKTLLDRGISIVALKGKNALSCDQKAEVKTFVGFEDLEHLLSVSLSSNQFDAVIHLAAVSDYVVKEIEVGEKVYASGEISKIDSSDEIAIRLKKTPKLISKIRDLSPRSMLIGFKLTNTAVSQERFAAVGKLFSTSNPDYVVHNDLSEITASIHKTTIFNKDMSSSSFETKEELANALYEIIKEGRA